MLKTVKNGSGIRVDPPPLFFQNSHIFPFFFWTTSPFTCGASSASGRRAPPQERLTHLLFPFPPFMKGSPFLFLHHGRHLHRWRDPFLHVDTHRWSLAAFPLPHSSFLPPGGWRPRRASSHPSFVVNPNFLILPFQLLPTIGPYHIPLWGRPHVNISVVRKKICWVKFVISHI